MDTNIIPKGYEIVTPSRETLVEKDWLLGAVWSKEWVPVDHVGWNMLNANGGTTVVYIRPCNRNHDLPACKHKNVYLGGADFVHMKWINCRWCLDCGAFYRPARKRWIYPRNK